MTQSDTPHFLLQRIYDDGVSSEPEIVPLTSIPWEANASRRGFLGSGLAASTVLALVGSGTARADNNSRTAKKSVRAHEKGISDLAISPDGHWLASSSYDQSIKLWRLPGGKWSRTLTGHRLGVTSLCISGDGQLVISGSSDNTIKLWSLPEGDELETLTGHRNAVRALAASRDGRLVASGSSDKTIRLWALHARAEIATLDGHADSVEALRFADDGRLLISGSKDASIKLWSLPAGVLEKSLEGHGGTITGLATNPDETLLFSRAQDKTFKVWNLSERKLVRTLSTPWDRVNAFTIVPSGSLMATCYGSTINLWSLPKGELLAVLTEHRADVLSLAITPDGSTLVSGDRQGVIILWDLRTRDAISFVFDPAANPEAAQGVTFDIVNSTTGRTITYTLPCGSPIPPNAVCVCNCVPGTLAVPMISRVPRPPRAPRTGYVPPMLVPRSQSSCTCNQVCICIPVCQAHRLLDPDPWVRRVAQQVLLLLGWRHLDYMHWAAANADQPLRQRIVVMMRRILAGRKADPQRWPDIEACLNLLDHHDEVVRLMAAQLLQRGHEVGHWFVMAATLQRVRQTLDASRARIWMPGRW